MDITLPTNLTADLDASEPLTVLKWLDDGVNAPGFYFFTRAAGEDHFTLGAPAGETHANGHIYVLDGDVASGAEANGGGGADVYVITADLNTSITIQDQDNADTDVVQFGAGFVARSIAITRFPVDDAYGALSGAIQSYQINFFDAAGGAQTITIVAPEDFQYRLGEDGALLSFEAFNSQTHQDDGFAVAEPDGGGAGGSAGGGAGGSAGGGFAPSIGWDFTGPIPTGSVDENTTAETDTGLRFTATDAEGDEITITVYEVVDGVAESTVSTLV